MPDHPNVWTDGRREDFSSIGGFEIDGAGVYLPASELAFDGLVWGTAEIWRRPSGALPCFSACSWGRADCSACCVLGCRCCSSGILALSLRY